jgi:signal transduction histidine kinase
MSLRARLVLVLGSLVALLLAAEWSLVRALTRDLDQEVDVVALTVGSSVLSLFAPADGEAGTSAPVAAHGSRWLTRSDSHERPLPFDGEARVERRVVVHAPGPPHLAERAEERAALARAFDALRPFRPADVHMDDGSLTFDGDLEVLVLRADAPDQIAFEGQTFDQAEGMDGQPALAPRAGHARVALRIGSQVTAVPAEPTLRHLTMDATESWTMATARPSSTTEPTGASALRIPVPRGGLDRAVETFLSKLLLGSIALFALGLGAIAWVAHRVTRPLRNLADAAERVGRGQLGTVVDEAGDRDVTKTLRAFNDMSLRLAALDEEAQRLRDREHLGELGDVARGLAHALRNPLHTLGLAVDALGTGRDDARETVRAARTQIQRLDGALEGFLTLAGAGGIREEVALDDLARDVALELAQSTQPCAVRVLAEGGPVPIACVPAELRAVVHALVVNAAEAAPGEPVVVRVEKTQDPLAQPLTGQRGEGGDRARLEVLDRGPGLAPDVRARLFTPHVTTKAHGTGMGLYLAERIARTRYGGSLELHDRPGGGVRAVLELLLVGGERA